MKSPATVWSPLSERYFRRRLLYIDATVSEGDGSTTSSRSSPTIAARSSARSASPRELGQRPQAKLVVGGLRRSCWALAAGALLTGSRQTRSRGKMFLSVEKAPSPRGHRPLKGHPRSPSQPSSHCRGASFGGLIYKASKGRSRYRDDRAAGICEQWLAASFVNGDVAATTVARRRTARPTASPSHAIAAGNLPRLFPRLGALSSVGGGRTRRAGP